MGLFLLHLVVVVVVVKKAQKKAQKTNILPRCRNAFPWAGLSPRCEAARPSYTSSRLPPGTRRSASRDSCQSRSAFQKAQFLENTARRRHRARNEVQQVVNDVKYARYMENTPRRNG